MVKLLMIMHNIALCTPCIALVNGGYLFACALDHAVPKTEIQAVQVRWVFGDPQVSSCEDANIVVVKVRSSASNHIP
jgi:hypothetical protein